jgi:hypothetical protein
MALNQPQNITKYTSNPYHKTSQNRPQLLRIKDKLQLRDYEMDIQNKPTVIQTKLLSSKKWETIQDIFDEPVSWKLVTEEESC